MTPETCMLAFNGVSVNLSSIRCYHFPNTSQCHSSIVCYTNHHQCPFIIRSSTFTTTPMSFQPTECTVSSVHLLYISVQCTHKCAHKDQQMKIALLPFHCNPKAIQHFPHPQPTYIACLCASPSAWKQERPLYREVSFIA